MPTNWGAIAPATARKSKDYMKGQPCAKNTIAYCHNIRHLGALSKDMLKQHQCLQKNCKFLEKNEDHPYWNQRYWHKVTKTREKKYKKYLDNYVHAGVKKTTGKLLNVSSSNINSDFGEMLRFFDELEIFHAYLFYKDGSMKMRYVGGFYGSEVAHEEAMKHILQGQGEYLVVAGDEGSLIGYRIENRSKALIEIDLTWGYLYPALSSLVSKDMDLRRKTA
jgi:hypothetical protein